MEPAANTMIWVRSCDASGDWGISHEMAMHWEFGTRGICHAVAMRMLKR